MKKKDTIIGAAVLTLALGGALVLGNGVLASQALAADQTLKNSALESPAVVKLAEVVPSDNSAVLEPLGDGAIILSVEESNRLRAERNLTTTNDPTALPYKEGQPGDSDMAQDIMVPVALKALQDKYAFTDETLGRFNVTAKYYTLYEDIATPVWWVNLDPKNADDFSEIGCYWGLFDAATGETVKLCSMADGKG